MEPRVSLGQRDLRVAPARQVRLARMERMERSVRQDPVEHRVRLAQQDPQVVPARQVRPVQMERWVQRDLLAQPVQPEPPVPERLSMPTSMR